MKNNIEQLLEKYFEGNTSIVEEKVLKEYFNGETVAEGLLIYKDLFQYFSTAKVVQLDSTKLSEPWKDAKVRKLKPKARTAVWLSIAASIALLIGFWFYQMPSQQETNVAEIDWSKYEPKDSEEALRYTVAALELLSEKLNGGAKKAAKELNRVGEVQRLIQNRKKGEN